MRTNIILASTICALLALPAIPAEAGKKGGVSLPNAQKVGGKKLVLNGMGIREATVFNVDVYVAGLYLEKKSSSSADIVKPEQAKQLLLHFVREVDRDDLVDAFEEGFEKNGGGALKAKVSELNGWMNDARVGDRLKLAYEPGKGTTVSVKGKKKGTIEGADFARVLFTIFIGPKPPNASLKSGLLGQG